MIIWALATLGHHDQDFENAWIEQATIKLDEFKPQQLANSIWALAKLGRHDRAFEDAWLEKARFWLTETNPKLRDGLPEKFFRFNARQLVESTWALAKLRHHDEDFKNAWLEIVRINLAKFNTRQLVESIFALAKLGHHDPAFEDAWIEQATIKLDQFNLQDFCQVGAAMELNNYLIKQFFTVWRSGLNDFIDYKLEITEREKLENVVIIEEFNKPKMGIEINLLHKVIKIAHNLEAVIKAGDGGKNVADQHQVSVVLKIADKIEAVITPIDGATDGAGQLAENSEAVNKAGDSAINVGDQHNGGNEDNYNTEVNILGEELSGIQLTE